VFHCSVINVPCGLAPASAATLIGYQTPKPLSTTFLFYYQSFLFSAPLFCGAEDILALTDPFGKHYFHYFCFLFLGYYSLEKVCRTGAADLRFSLKMMLAPVFGLR
jgi:hypothetical protein